MELVQLLVTALVGTGTGAGGSYLQFVRNMGALDTKVKALETTVKELNAAAKRWPRESMNERIARIESSLGYDGEVRRDLRRLQGEITKLADDFRAELREVADRHGDALSREEFGDYATATGQRLDRLLEKLGEVRGKLDSGHR